MEPDNYRHENWYVSEDFKIEIWELSRGADNKSRPLNEYTKPTHKNLQTIYFRFNVRHEN